MNFEEAYQQIRENHYKILDERESVSKSARLSLSTWILDILTECREADTPQTEVTKEDFIEQIKDARLEIKPLTVCNITECDYHKYCKERGQTDCGWK